MLKQITSDIKEIKGDIKEIKKQIMALKIKSASTAAVVSIVVALVLMLLGKLYMQHDFPHKAKVQYTFSYEKQHIYILEFNTGLCTTSLVEHMFLTAAHCVIDSDPDSFRLVVNGYRVALKIVYVDPDRDFAWLTIPNVDLPQGFRLMGKIKAFSPILIALEYGMIPSFILPYPGCVFKGDVVPGNSGAPIFNEHGYVVAIVVATHTFFNLGFCEIPTLPKKSQ